MNLVTSSSREDWQTIPRTNVAAYNDNPAITMAWGLNGVANFEMGWASKFSDPSVCIYWIDVFYKGSLICRGNYASVDGGKAILPIPRHASDDENMKAAELVVPEREYYLMELIDSLENRSEYNSYFARAGFHIIDEDWPR
jgi:hypothetical protein